MTESMELQGYLDGDFLQTWDKSQHQLASTAKLAQNLQQLHRDGFAISPFNRGLAVSIFRDHSTRTRFSYASAANFLGLALSELDEEKSQIAHGETTRETATMISFLSEAVGIRDDMYLGAGHSYMTEFAEALQESYDHGVLPQRPAVINLQCDRDHPTQSMSDLCHLMRYFKCGPEGLAGKKIAMSWAYSPSYGKPLSVPQGIIGLLTRFGMDVCLANPEGYTLIGDIEELSATQAKESGGSFTITHSMDEAFENADIVYPKSWAPMWVMQQRTELLRSGDQNGLKALETECLENNKRYVDWHCDAKKMALTKGGKALYMHCLPADITGVSCEHGEVSKDVFEAARLETYHEASFKPFVIAAMILLARVEPHAIDRLLADPLARRR